jgi:hypothetical protein
LPAVIAWFDQRTSWELDRNRRADPRVADPASDEQRAAIAESCALRLRMTIPVLIEGPDNAVDQAKLDRSLAGASPLGSVYAARRRAAPRGANFWLRVSMCQIACASRRATSIWAILAPALLAEPPLVALVALGVGRMLERVHRRLDQRPPQVAGTVLGQGPAPVCVARLVDARAKAGVAGELLG